MKLIALAVLFILSFTIHPAPAGHDLHDGWSFALLSGDNATAELLQNLILFVPFGIALARAAMGRVTLIAAGALLSFAIEFTQQWLPGRDPSIGDIMTNTIGTAVGGALVWTASRWLLVAPQRAPWLALNTALAAAGVWLGTGWLLRPDYPPTTYFDRWTPKVRHEEQYSGRIVEAALGPIPLRRGPIPGARELLLANKPLRFTAVAGRPPGDAAPLVIITAQRRRSILGVGVRGHDLLLSRWTNGAGLGLDRPRLRLEGALARVAPGDTFTVSTAQFAGLGYTAGDGWKLIFYPEHFPPWLLRIVNALWVGGTVLGVGWWGGGASGLRRHGASRAALAVAAVTLALGPGLVGLNPTPPGEWLGAVAGMALGAWLARRSASFGWAGV